MNYWNDRNILSDQLIILSVFENKLWRILSDAEFVITKIQDQDFSKY